MNNQYVYAGAADSGRIIRLGAPVLTKITSAGSSAVLFHLKSWELYPAGPGGVVVFRMFVVRFRVTAGYNVRITPFVDGVALDAQDFSASGAAEVAIPVYFVARGAYCACQVEQLERLGDFELIDIEAGYKIIRASP